MSDTLPVTFLPITGSHTEPQTAHTRNREVPAAVLDSNAVLDWLLFGDPSMQPLGQAIRAGHCRWIVTPALRDELEHVMARGLRNTFMRNVSRLSKNGGNMVGEAFTLRYIPSREDIDV